MGFTKIAEAVGKVSCLVLLMAGCATTSRTGRTSIVATPQEKAHQDQLSEIGREDGASAAASAKRPAAPQPAASRRRTGQGIIDQPVRR